MIVSSKVTAVYKNSQLLDYLAQRFTYRSAAEWGQWVADGRVSINGRVATATDPLRQGDVVACQLPDEPLPDTFNFDYEIIYQDDWLLAVNKPGNLLVHDKGRFTQANLIYHLRQRHQPPHPEARLVNRLDRLTSGVILAARDSDTLRQMQQLFVEQQVEKQYLAVVHGVPSTAVGVIDLPVGKLPSLPGVYRFGVVAEGKTAVTHYQTVQTFADQFALLRLWPKTGRTHQLRVHLQAIGHPIVGDALYNLADDEAYLAWARGERPFAEGLLARQALHCAQVQFHHPQQQRPCLIEAPLPADIKWLLQRLSQTEERGAD